MASRPVSRDQCSGIFIRGWRLRDGWLATKLYQKHPGAIAWVPGIGLALSVPFYVFAFTTDNLLCCHRPDHRWICKVRLHYRSLTIGQGVVTTRRAGDSRAAIRREPDRLRIRPSLYRRYLDIFFVNGVAELGVAAEELTRNQCHPRLSS